MPDGKVLCEASREDEAILVHEVDASLIPETRKSIPYLSDYDVSLTPGGRL